MGRGELVTPSTCTHRLPACISKQTCLCERDMLFPHFPFNNHYFEDTNDIILLFLCQRELFHSGVHRVQLWAMDMGISEGVLFKPPDKRSPTKDFSVLSGHSFQTQQHVSPSFKFLLCITTTAERQHFGTENAFASNQNAVNILVKN